MVSEVVAMESDHKHLIEAAHELLVSGAAQGRLVIEIQLRASITNSSRS
jgi:hypothetical protein